VIALLLPFGQKWRFVPVLGFLALLLVVAAAALLFQRKKEDGLKKPAKVIVSCVLCVLVIGLLMVPSFLFTGYKGLPVTGEYPIGEASAILVDSSRADPFEQDGSFREVPVAYIPAAAGTGNFLDEADLFEKVSFPEDKVPRGADVGIRVSGDSMEPVYHDGQIVFVQKCSALNPGEVGIFEYDGKAYIKLYREREPEEEFLEEFTDSYGTVHPQPLLVSYNGKYDPIEVNPYSTFRVLGRVLK